MDARLLANIVPFNTSHALWIAQLMFSRHVSALLLVRNAVYHRINGILQRTTGCMLSTENTFKFVVKFFFKSNNQNKEILNIFFRSESSGTRHYNEVRSILHAQSHQKRCVAIVGEELSHVYGQENIIRINLNSYFFNWKVNSYTSLHK